MAALKIGVVKGFVIGDIDVALVGKDAHIDLPVRERQK